MTPGNGRRRTRSGDWPIGRRRRGIDDVGVGRRGSDRARHAGVAAGDGDRGAGGDGRVVGLLDQVEARLIVRVVVVAERLVEDVDVVGGDRVVDRVEEARVVAGVLGAEDVEADELGAGGHPLDADVAGSPHRVGTVSGDVVGLPALGGDRAGVTERLFAPGRHVRPLATEVLVVDEDVRSVRTDEVRIVDVQPIGDEAHRHAAAVEAERAGGLRPGNVGVDVHRLQRLAG